MKSKPQDTGVLVIHNKYLDSGGEDESFRANMSMLGFLGYRVYQLKFDNIDFVKLSLVQKSITTLWNSSAYNDVYNLCIKNNISYVHIHNCFPLASPSIYYAAKNAGAKVIQWLHNYRIICPSATFLRAGSICEDCMGKHVSWPALLHSCYRDSKLASFGVVAMLSAHRSLGTWKTLVDKFIALTDFAKNKFVEAGFEEGKIVVIPNHMHPTPSIGGGNGKYGMFVGRLSEEKGIDTLAKLAVMNDLEIEIKVFGDGPMSEVIQSAAVQSNIISIQGHVSSDEIQKNLADAQFLVFPSKWYEGLPRTIIEAFSVGTPVLASPIGAMRDLVVDGYNGLHFRLADHEDLGRAIRSIVNGPELRVKLRNGARQSYDAQFTLNRVSEKVQMLMQSKT